MSTSNGTTFGYRLYVRSLGQPVICDHKSGLPALMQVIAAEWVQVPTQTAEVGTPNPLYCRIASEEAGLLAFATANALAAQLSAAVAFSPLQFRMEKVKLTYSWKAEGEGFSEPFDYSFEAERCVTFAPDESAGPASGEPK